MSLTLEFTGDSIADSPFARFSFLRASAAFLDEAGPAVREALKAAAPVGKDSLDGRKGGRLRDSIRYERETTGEGASGIFTANVPYAGYVIDGTVPHTISASAARFLRYEGSDGQYTYARSVHHPGTKANDFPGRALPPLEPLLRAWFAAAVRESAEGA